MSRTATTGALADVAVGSGRIILAPDTVDVATLANPFDVLPAERDAQGEYPVELPYFDTGFMSDEPSYTHSAESEGLEFVNASGVLFEKVTAIEQTIELNVASFNPRNLALIDNVDPALIETIAASSGKSGWTKIPVGSYSSGRRFRGLLVSDFASDDPDDLIVESDGTKRPRTLIRVMPLLQLAIGEDREISFARDGVNCDVTLNIVEERSLPVDERRGYWAIETAGTITA